MLLVQKHNFIILPITYNPLKVSQAFSKLVQFLNQFSNTELYSSKFAEDIFHQYGFILLIYRLHIVQNDHSFSFKIVEYDSFLLDLKLKTICTICESLKPLIMVQ